MGVIRGDDLITNPDAQFRFCAHDLVAIIGTDDARHSFGKIVISQENEQVSPDMKYPD